MLDGLTLAVVGLPNEGPFRPLVTLTAHLWRSSVVLKLANALATLAQRRGDAVGAGVAAADDDNVLALGRDLVVMAVQQRLGGSTKVVDGKNHAFGIGARSGNGAGSGSAHGNDNRIEVGLQPFSHSRIGRIGVQLDGDAVFLQELDTAVHHFLGKLHVGNAVHKKAAGAIVALEHGYLASQFHQLPSGTQAAGA